MHKAIQLQQERERSQRRLRWEVVKQTRASLKGIGWEDSAASEALKVARQKSRRSLAFESADTNNNNALSREEFRLAALELLKVAELDHMEGELSQFIENEFDVMDADGSGEMDREEFGATFDLALYERVRTKYNASTHFPHLLDKTSGCQALDFNEIEEQGKQAAARRDAFVSAANKFFAGKAKAE